MNTTGLPFSQAIQAVRDQHPHWHIWHTDTLIWATRPQSAHNGSGTTLDAPTPELMHQVLSAWEHKHRWAA